MVSWILRGSADRGISNFKLAGREGSAYYRDPIMENQMEKNIENEMEAAEKNNGESNVKDHGR